MVPLLGAMWMSGCTSPPGTIIREKQVLDNGQLITTDARQRAITSQKPDISTKPGVVVPSNITCVEPQPSVALALANSFGAGVSIFQRGSGAVSSAVSEGVFQLDERTIAIQALLNAGYQNCLDYSNGAITNTFYAIRASNLDNLLVTLTLASESAGNLRSALGSAGGKAQAEAEASQSFLPGAIEDIQKSAEQLGDANRKTEAAADKLEEAKKAHEAAEFEVEKAESDVNNAPEPKPENLTKALEEKQGEEKTAATAVEEAQAEYDAAAQAQDDLEQAMSSKIDAAASASAASRAKGAAGPSGRPTDTAVLTMGEMQRRFLERSTASQNITACLVELGLATADPKQDSPTFERDLWEAIKASQGGAAGIGIEEFVILSRSERDSKLAAFCSAQLPGIVYKAQQSEQELAMERVKNERLEVVLHLIQVLAQRSEQCSALTGEDEPTKKLRSECLKQLESVQQYVQRELS